MTSCLSESCQLALIEIEKLKHQRQGKRVVFVSGLFNILHPGHLRLLRFASECGDLLVVGVIKENQELQLIDAQSRLEFVQSIDWVNFAFLLDQPAEQLIEHLKPEVVVKGKEHEKSINPESGAIQTYGGSMIFSSGESTFSSAEITRNPETHDGNIVLPKGYLTRHDYTFTDLTDLISSFHELNACVVGDTIVDEYIQCDPVGMSQEDPTIVVTPIAKTQYLGGAAIVASHIKGLGANRVDYISVLGTDPLNEFVERRCQEYNVNSQFFYDPNRPTTLKQRFRSRNKTLLRVNHLRQHHISVEIQHRIVEQLETFIGDLDLLIFSDFNYGILPQTLIKRITKLCKQHSVMCVADSQCSSQFGDISRFDQMTFITPTEHEARQALHNNEDGLVILTEMLRKKCEAETIFLTLGEEGVLIHASDQKTFKTDRLPAFNKAPIDCSGAGDSFMAAAALAMAKRSDCWLSAYLGSLAAACQVSRVGNRPIKVSDLLSLLASNVNKFEG